MGAQANMFGVHSPAAGCANAPYSKACLSGSKDTLGLSRDYAVRY